MGVFTLPYGFLHFGSIALYGAYSCFLWITFFLLAENLGFRCGWRAAGEWDITRIDALSASVAEVTMPTPSAGLSYRQTSFEGGNIAEQFARLTCHRR